MEGREVTNILLAIIAGVLLFGREAMVGGLKGLFFIIAIILLIYLILAGTGALIRGVLETYRATKSISEFVFVIFGFIWLAALVCLFSYSGWLWYNGVDRPFDATFDTNLGKVWSLLLIALVGSFALLALRKGMIWVNSNYREIPDYLRYGTRYVGGMIVAPITFPIREWQFKRSEGSGVVGSIFASAYACLIGFAQIGLLAIGLGAVLGMSLHVFGGVASLWK
jgi:tryptophan-rich sensory protein